MTFAEHLGARSPSVTGGRTREPLGNVDLIPSPCIVRGALSTDHLLGIPFLIGRRWLPAGPAQNPQEAVSCLRISRRPVTKQLLRLRPRPRTRPSQRPAGNCFTARRRRRDRLVNRRTRRSAQAQSNEPIKIGLLEDQSGNIALFSMPKLHARQLAIQEINNGFTLASAGADRPRRHWARPTASTGRSTTSSCRPVTRASWGGPSPSPLPTALIRQSEVPRARTPPHP